MSNVVIINKNINNQKINLANNRVFLPFNVNINILEKLILKLKETNISFDFSNNKLNISDLKYKNIVVKENKPISNSKITLSKTYVVTMKNMFIDKSINFYNKVKKISQEIPVFNITNETNLQNALNNKENSENIKTNENLKAALQEATTELSLSDINSELKTNVENNNNQILSNNPLGETIIETPVDLKSNPKTLIRKKTNSGNVLTILVVVVWLGLVLVGSVKLVTYILS